MAIYDPDTLRECDVAVLDENGALLNRDAAMGELVNTAGGGLFHGYYKDRDSTAQWLRHGMYWSGDLAYRDADGWIYFAGRTADWMRVDGENMTAAPIERILLRLPVINRVAVYPVPDERVGDQVMAAIVVQDGDLTPEQFEEFLAAQRDLSPKAWPRYVWLADDLPTTATNKILKRELMARGVDPVGRVLWKRDGTSFRAVWRASAGDVAVTNTRRGAWANGGGPWCRSTRYGCGIGGIGGIGGMGGIGGGCGTPGTSGTGGTGGGAGIVVTGCCGVGVGWAPATPGLRPMRRGPRRRPVRSWRLAASVSSRVSPFSYPSRLVFG